MKTSAALPFLLILLSAAASFAAITDQQREFFESRIRPVLIEHCYECHNSNDTSEAGLALDCRPAMAEGGENGAVISTTDPASSLLLRVLRHEIDGVKMPENGPKLDAKVIADFEKWIRMGAPDPRAEPPSKDELAKATSWESIRDRRKQWWSFQPIQPPLIPASDAQHNVDRFILAKLGPSGLNPAPSADRRTLIRRAHFVITGLPPSAEETDAFIADHSPDAFEKLVDRLLESPAYGERWARHWMDWMRYAESHGSEGDPAIQNAWHYRDYLIRALNEDIPYDQMLKEHIAGDLLPQPRVNEELGVNESLLATAHWRMVFHGFAPTDALDEKVRFTDDQIDTFSKAFLGLTVSCARCHDHKFDAISQADYYALFGILGSSRPGRAPMETLEVQSKNFDALADLKPQIREKLAADWLASLDGLPAKLLDNATSDSAENAESLLHLWHELEKLPTDGKSKDVKQWWSEQGEKYREENDVSKIDFVRNWKLSDPDAEPWFANGIGVRGTPSPAGDFMLKHEGAGDGGAVERILPAGIHAGTISTKHPSRLASPDFGLGENEELYLRVDGGGSAMTRYVVENYPRNGTVFPVKNLQSKEAGKWRWHKYDLAYWSGDSLHVELTAARDAPLLSKNDERSWFTIRDAFTIKKGDPTPPDNRREFLSALFTDDFAPESREALADHYQQTIAASVKAWRSGKINDEQTALLDRALRDGLLANKLADLKNARPLIEKYRALENEVPVTTRVPTLAEWRGKDSPLFTRGNHKQPGDTVPRRFLESIDDTPYEATDGGRIQLANDMLRADNPFTRRVITNRVWHYVFGSGLVETTDNFGRLGSQPSHPELLDHLADRFSTDDNWSLKSLIRFLVTSKTWQQSSQASPDANEKDPLNRLLSHASVRRMEAEIIRDTLLATDGRLDRKQYGGPVDGNSNRRSVYVKVIRNRLDPFLSAFDAPVPFRATGRREATNVPAQSLLMMNDLFVIQSATELANQVQSQNDNDRVERLWRRALGRAPKDAEKKAAIAFVSDLKKQYGSQDERRQELMERIAELQRSQSDLLDPIRQRLLAAKSKNAENAEPIELKPIASWDFEKDASDRNGNLHLKLHGDAKIDDGALVLNGNAWAMSGDLDRKYTAKSFEAIVQLDNLEQRGSGVITMQTSDAVIFDSLVLGEQSPGHWMAGSDGFSRTKSFDGPAETTAHQKPVHFVVTYDEQGNVTGYRNGEPYGKPYRVDLHTFGPKDSQVLFGMRHGTGKTDGRMLHGRIYEAHLYDRALSPNEVAVASGGKATFVTESEMFEQLTPSQTDNVTKWREELKQLSEQKQALEKMPSAEHAWIDLAHSIYNLKEFIYVR